MSNQIPSKEELTGRIIFTEQEINGIVFEQTKRANSYIVGNNMSELTLITVKNGAIPYSKELKSMIIDMVNPTNHKFTIIDDYITVKSRYGTTSGELIVVEDIKTDITGKFVLVAEDIEDSGKTLNFLYEHLKLKNPRDVRFSVFIKRGIGYLRDYTVDVGAYTLSKLWLVGFGMDYYEHYRDLPYLAEVKEKFCQK